MSAETNRRGRRKGWSERGENGGRPKGSRNAAPKKERKQFKTFSISCSEQEYETIKALALRNGLTVSRLLVGAVINRKSHTD